MACQSSWGGPSGAPAVDGQGCWERERCCGESLRAVRQQFADARIILAGVIGSASDGYATDEPLSTDAAFAYHRDKPMSLRDSVSIFSARQPFRRSRDCLVLRTPWWKAGRPYALAPMLHPNGRMLDGTPLADAIARIDAESSPPPRHYMLVCLIYTRPNSAAGLAHCPVSGLVKRVRGLKANASPLAPEDLDKLNHLAILGGCCGTDERYIEALAGAAVDQEESAA